PDRARLRRGALVGRDRVGPRGAALRVAPGFPAARGDVAPRGEGARPRRRARLPGAYAAGAPPRADGVPSTRAAGRPSLRAGPREREAGEPRDPADPRLRRAGEAAEGV